jgi:hypothetical protein
VETVLRILMPTARWHMAMQYQHVNVPWVTGIAARSQICSARRSVWINVSLSVPTKEVARFPAMALRFVLVVHLITASGVQRFARPVASTVHVSISCSHLLKVYISMSLNDVGNNGYYAVDFFSFFFYFIKCIHSQLATVCVTFVFWLSPVKMSCSPCSFC